MVGSQRTAPEGLLNGTVTRHLRHRGIVTGTRVLLAAMALTVWALTFAMTTAVSLLRDADVLSLGDAIGIRGAYHTVIVLTVAFVFDRAFRSFGSETQAELDRLLAQEREVTDRLQELADARREIVHQVAHEIRTPLTVLTGSADVLSRRHDEMTSEQRAELLRTVAEACRRLGGLPDLLDRVMRPGDPDDLRALSRDPARVARPRPRADA